MVVWLVADCGLLPYQITENYKRVVTLQISTNTAISYTTGYSQLILKTMDIIVRTDDKIRLQNWNAKVFADVNSNSEQFGIDVTFYQLNGRLRLIEKERTYKMFVIPNDFPLDEYDFGWWKDGKVIWQSF
jgi:hypothetical protein